MTAIKLIHLIIGFVIGAISSSASFDTLGFLMACIFGFLIEGARKTIEGKFNIKNIVFTIFGAIASSILVQHIIYNLLS